MNTGVCTGPKYNDSLLSQLDKQVEIADRMKKKRMLIPLTPWPHSPCSREVYVTNRWPVMVHVKAFTLENLRILG